MMEMDWGTTDLDRPWASHHVLFRKLPRKRVLKLERGAKRKSQTEWTKY